MTHESLVLLMGVAAYLGIHHCWLWFGQRAERTHLWVAGWCANTLLFLVSLNLQISAPGAEQAALGGRLGWMSAIVLGVVMIGLSHALAGRDLSRRLLAGLLVVTGVLLLLVWRTNLLVTEGAYVRTDLLGQQYGAPVPGPLLPLLAPYILVLFAYCFWLIRSASSLERGERTAMLWGLVAYAAFAMNDLLHAARLIQSVRVFELGFVAVAIGLTYMLVRRYARGYANLQDEVAAQMKTNRESEERYRLLLDRTLAGLLWTRGDGEVIDCNRSVARLLGCDSPADIIDHNINDFYDDPGDRQTFLAGLAPGGTGEGREVRLRRRDGTPIWLRTNVRARDDGTFEGILVDISDQKRAAQAEREALELRAIAKLAAAAAHEINNPLAVVIGQSNLLKGDATDQRRIERIVEASRRINQIVNRMARITRVESYEPASAGLPPMLDLEKSTDPDRASDVS